MRREIKRYVEEYDRVHFNPNTGAGAFYLSDFTQIKELSGNSWELVNNALKAGFIVGYRKAQRDTKKSAHKAK